MTQIMINNVVAKYPKLNQPYRYDNEAGRSVACDHFEQGAAYSLDFSGLDKEQATAIYKASKAAYDEFAKGNKKAPKEMKNFPIAEDIDSGEITGKTKKAAAYSGERTPLVMQFDAKNKLLPDDFELTTGSKINICVKIVPYSTGMNNGVTFRLVAVQVLELAERQAYSPFAAVDDGYSFEESPKAEVEQDESPFSAAFSLQKPLPPEGDDIPF